jgi:hypothetical protein
MASHFLKNEDSLGEVLLMVDRDITWRSGDLEYLAWAAADTKSIVGGVYAKRGYGAGTAIRFREGQSFDDDLIEADYASTGFFAVHRSVLEAMAQTLVPCLDSLTDRSIDFWPFFMPMVQETRLGTEYLSEDWAFCERAKELGFKVYAAMRPTLVHYGEIGFTLDGSPAIVGSPVLDSLAEDAADFLGIASFEAQEGELARLWDGENEEQWYKRDDVGNAYIADLADWHLNQMPTLITENLARVRDMKVLDYGSGIGTWALIAAMQGCEVDCIEPNDRMWAFTQHRISKMNGTLQSPSQLQRLDSPDGDYDVAIAWHILEHVPDPERVAAEIVASLKPGGALLTDSDFHVDELHPMHHAEGDADAIWEGLGLKCVGGPWWEKGAL